MEAPRRAVGNSGSAAANKRNQYGCGQDAAVLAAASKSINVAAARKQVSPPRGRSEKIISSISLRRNELSRFRIIFIATTSGCASESRRSLFSVREEG